MRFISFGGHLINVSCIESLNIESYCEHHSIALHFKGFDSEALYENFYFKLPLDKKAALDRARRRFKRLLRLLNG